MAEFELESINSYSSMWCQIDVTRLTTDENRTVCSTSTRRKYCTIKYLESLIMAKLILYTRFWRKIDEVCSYYATVPYPVLSSELSPLSPCGSLLAGRLQSLR